MIQFKCLVNSMRHFEQADPQGDVVTTFFVMQSDGNLVVTRSDGHPFNDYMKEGLRNLPTVTQVIDYGRRLEVELESTSTLTAEAVQSYIDRMATNLHQQKDAATQLRRILLELGRANGRPAPRRTDAPRQPRQERPHWSDEDAGMFDILNPFTW